MIFEELDEFKKDLRSLLKKFRTLNDDLDVAKQVLEVLPDERAPFSYRIDNFEGDLGKGCGPCEFLWTLPRFVARIGKLFAGAFTVISGS
ncbi:MAG: hypothetical protein U1D64_03285 [Bacteroidales bacterium]|nr:hypothetical protein [Bacteroidales bacterium]